MSSMALSLSLSFYISYFTTPRLIDILLEIRVCARALCFLSFGYGVQEFQSLLESNRDKILVVFTHPPFPFSQEG